MKSGLTRIAVMILASWLAGCSIFGTPTDIDETKGWTAQRLYEEGDKSMRTRDYEKALKYFQTLESRYPHGKYALQAQLETAYAYFKRGIQRCVLQRQTVLSSCIPITPMSITPIISKVWRLSMSAVWWKDSPNSKSVIATRKPCANPFSRSRS